MNKFWIIAICIEFIFILILICRNRRITIYTNKLYAKDFSHLRETEKWDEYIKELDKLEFFKMMFKFWAPIKPNFIKLYDLKGVSFED